MATTRELVNGYIADNTVMVFSKSYCPFCTKAKRALQAVLDASKITVLEIEDRSDMDEIQNILSELTGARSVPRVFIGGKCIGGGDETSQLLANGQLKQMLTDNGVL